MTYGSAQGNDMEGAAHAAISPMEGGVLPIGFLTFEAVQERLVEAMITCWRHPDRERGWQRVRSAWPEVTAEALAGDYDGGRSAGEQRVDAALRPAAQTRTEIAEMEEAFGWTAVLAGDERRLVGLVIAMLARGRREVSWRHLLKPMGLTHGADRLRMRYGRAIHAICSAGNCGNHDRQTNYVQRSK